MTNAATFKVPRSACEKLRTGILVGQAECVITRITQQQSQLGVIILLLVYNNLLSISVETISRDVLYSYRNACTYFEKNNKNFNF